MGEGEPYCECTSRCDADRAGAEKKVRGKNFFLLAHLAWPYRCSLQEGLLKKHKMGEGELYCE